MPRAMTKRAGLLLLVARAAAVPVHTRDRKDLSSSLLPGDALVAPSASSDTDLERRVVTCRDLYDPPGTLLYGIDDAQIWHEKFCGPQEGKADLIRRGDWSWLATLASQIMSRFRGSSRRNSGWRKCTMGLMKTPTVQGRLLADFKKMGLDHAMSGAAQLFYHLVITCDVDTSLSFLLYWHKVFGGLHPMAPEWRYNKDGGKEAYFTSEEYVVLTAYMRSPRSRTFFGDLRKRSGRGAPIRLYEVIDPSHTLGHIRKVSPKEYVDRVDSARTDSKAREDNAQFEASVERMKEYMKDKLLRLSRGSVAAAARCAPERHGRGRGIKAPSDTDKSVADRALFKCLFSNEPPCYVGGAEAPPRKDARQLGASSSRDSRSSALTDKQMKRAMFGSDERPR